MLRFIEINDEKKPLYSFKTEKDKINNAKLSCDVILSAALIIPKDVIVLDFDEDNIIKDSNGNIISNKEGFLIRYLIQNYNPYWTKSNNNHYHLYFKKPKKVYIRNWADYFTCGGFQVDYRTEHNGLAVVKTNGVMRECKEPLTEEVINTLPELPIICYPLHSNVGQKTCFIDLKEHDGRNNALFYHINSVYRKYKFNPELLYEIGNFINTFLFKEPLSEEEIKSFSLRAKDYSSLKKSDNNDNDNEIEEYEDFVKGKEEPLKEFLIRISRLYVEKYDLHIACSQIYYLKDGKYFSDIEELSSLLYSDYQYARNEYLEIIFQIKIIAPKYTEKDEIILVNNGAIKNNEFIRDDKEFSPYYIDVEYDENAYDENVDSFLQMITCNYDSKEKNELRLVIEEMLGHCLMTKNFPHKIFILLGTGANGKSTLMNSLYNLFGDLATNVPINKLDRDDYVARLTNKLVNISDDVDFSYIKSSQNVKTLASGDYIVGRELYQKAYNFRNKATLIFSLNEMVLFADHSYGLYRRLCIIPFLHNIVNPNPKYLDLLTTNNAKKYWFKLAMEGRERIIKNGNSITKSEKIEDLVNNYIIDTDSVSSYLKAYGIEDLSGRVYAATYTDYVNYCIGSAGFEPYSKNKFSRILSSKGYTTIVKNSGGKKYREIVKVNNIVKSGLQNK